MADIPSIEPQNKYTLYVEELTSEVRKIDLERFFERFGKFNISVFQKNHALLTFEDYRDAEGAMYARNGMELCGRAVKIHKVGSQQKGISSLLSSSNISEGVSGLTLNDQAGSTSHLGNVNNEQSLTKLQTLKIGSVFIHKEPIEIRELCPNMYGGQILMEFWIKKENEDVTPVKPAEIYQCTIPIRIQQKQGSIVPTVLIGAVSAVVQEINSSTLTTVEIQKQPTDYAIPQEAPKIFALSLQAIFINFDTANIQIEVGQPQIQNDCTTSSITYVSYMPIVIPSEQIMDGVLSHTEYSTNVPIKVRLGGQTMPGYPPIAISVNNKRFPVTKCGEKA